MLMAIESAQLEDVPLPAGGISICGAVDSSISFGMDGPNSAWDATVNPHEVTVEFKPGPAIPEYNPSAAHPFLPSMEVALHPLASPILCPDEMFKALPPLLMMVSDGELMYKDFSITPLWTC
jgi:acetyl esterase/lipase